MCSLAHMEAHMDVFHCGNTWCNTYIHIMCCRIIRYVYSEPHTEYIYYITYVYAHILFEKWETAGRKAGGREGGAGTQIRWLLYSILVTGVHGNTYIYMCTPLLWTGPFSRAFGLLPFGVSAAAVAHTPPFHWDESRIEMSHITHVWVLSQIRMRHVPHEYVSSSCHACTAVSLSWVISHVWMWVMSHADESHDTCECVTSHVNESFVVTHTSLFHWVMPHV